jgi:hypothetical protein
MTDPKCEELIDERLKYVLETTLPDFDSMDVAELKKFKDDAGMGFDEPDDDDLHEWQSLVESEHRDSEMQNVLSIEKKTLITVLLSFGGPSDGFDFTFDKDGELDSCYYWYKDWFDGARREVPMAQAQQLVDLYCIDPKA